MLDKNILDNLCNQTQSRSTADIDINDLPTKLSKEIVDKLNNSQITLNESFKLIQIYSLKNYPDIWIKMYNESNDKDRYELLKIAKHYELIDSIKQYIEKNKENIDR